MKQPGQVTIFYSFFRWFSALRIMLVNGVVGGQEKVLVLCLLSPTEKLPQVNWEICVYWCLKDVWNQKYFPRSAENIVLHLMWYQWIVKMTLDQILAQKFGFLNSKLWITEMKNQIVYIPDLSSLLSYCFQKLNHYIYPLQQFKNSLTYLSF